jgi:hypothetical protein
MLHMVNQSHIKVTHNSPRYKFGYGIPRNYNEVMQFDLKNGNTLWREATDLEMSHVRRTAQEKYRLKVLISIHQVTGKG